MTFSFQSCFKNSLLLTVAFGLLMLPAALHAEPQINGGDATSDFSVEIDTVQSKNVGKSLGLALGLSFIVPGGGELYLKEKKQAKMFFLLETGFWSTLGFALLAKQSYLQSARNYASDHAGLDAGGKDEDFLSTVTKYRAYREKNHRKDSYESLQILSGKRDFDYEIPPQESNYWDFGSAAVESNTESWQSFVDATKAYGRARVVITWAVGGLLLSRLVSLINTLHVYRTTSVKGLQETRSAGRGAGNGEHASVPKPAWRVQPMAGSGFSGICLVLNF